MTTNLVTEFAAAANDLFQSGMSGKVAIPGDAEYQRARQIWNGAVDSEPAFFAVCESTADVQAAVRVARKHGMPLSVRGGGHDFAGRSLRHNGLVIDLSRMRKVEIDPWTQTAAAGGGTLAQDIAAVASLHKLIPVTGNVGAVGLAGLTLGGGYSPLLPKYGLAIDNLLAAEVVLADGRIVDADATENPDLFWALRGGGGNFGVVTKMRIRLHLVSQLIAGMIIFPWAGAGSVLLRWAEFSETAPEELGATTCLLCMPDGSPVVALAVAWCGEGTKGYEVIDQIGRLGNPIMMQAAPMSYDEMLHRFDGHVVNGRHCTAHTRWLTGLSPEVIAECIAAMDNRTSPFAAVVFHHFRGAPTRVPLESTAFGLRSEHYMTEILAGWEPANRHKSEIHRNWVRDLSQALAPLSLPGGYPNMLGPNEDEQIRFAFGANAERLMNLKKRFDPDSVFTSAIPLPKQG